MTRAEIEAGVQELYIGILGRAADYSGLQFWADGIANGLKSLEDTRAAFATPTQPEYWSIYGGLSNSELVDKVYQNFLERNPDESGKAFWVAQLDSGNIGADYLISSVINSAKYSDAAKAGTSIDAKVLANKVESAQYFTTKTKDANWSVDDFKKHAKAAVDGVNEDYATVQAAKSSADDYVKSLPPGPSSYSDRLFDAGDSVLFPTEIALNTSVSGVLGLRYSATDTDTLDYFTMTIPKTGILKLAQYGDRKIDVSVIAGTTHIMDNWTQKIMYPDPWIALEGAAQVFAGEQVVIQLSGQGAPTPGSGAAATDGLEYGFRFYME
ncbi:DUF4214 domain-containing protein [Pseudomonas putida]|uniref:DUF4214 domain-containing protein n=1 Tax=Pseudomonas putida TaxID=303 RepID=UPI00349E8B1D